METMTIKPREQRWAEEAAFFDAAAERTTDATLPIDPLAFRRYTRPRLRRRFNKEFRFKVLESLAGKRILDVGCGDGLNAVMFAKMGATVTGIDLSASAVEVARRRAAVNQVSDRVMFVCAPMEMADLADDSFDIVWGDGFLHHVLDELELVLSRAARLTKPDGLLMFSEPVNLCEPLRRLRRTIPARSDATPGERPMIGAELDVVRRYIPGCRIRHYSLFGRLDRFILPNFNYERAPVFRRTIVNGINLIDYALLSVPGLRRLGAMCVLYGYPRKTANGNGRLTCVASP